MLSYDTLLRQYRRFLPRNIRQNIPSPFKKKLRGHVQKVFGLEPTLVGNKKQKKVRGIHYPSDLFNLLDIYSNTEKKRLMMVVGNTISVDSRVLKSAQSIQDAGFHVLLVGMKPNKSIVTLTNFASIPAIILDSSVLKHSKDNELLSQSICEQMVPLINAYAPTHVYSHDFFGLAFVNGCLDSFNKKHFCHWTHDIHEYVPGLENAISQTRINWANKLESERLSIPDHILVVNEEIRDLMGHLFSPHQRVDILYNVPREFDSTSFNLRDACNIADNIPLGVYTGRATELRGLDVIIPALEALPTMHIALLSEGAKPYLKQLKLNAAEIGAEDRLHVFPYLPDQEVSEGIKYANFGIAPFQKYGNTELALATKLFEYLHAGIPVIGSDCRAMKKFIEEHKCGKVFTSGNHLELVNVIEKVISKPKTDYTVSNKLLKKFSWSSYYKPIAAYLHETTNFDKSERQFHGPGPSAGQPSIIANQMRKIGKSAYSVSIIKNSTFAYHTDISFPYNNSQMDSEGLLYWASRRFEIFHFYFRTTTNYVNEGSISESIFQDIHLLKALGCKTIMHFRGSEVRLQSEFEKRNKYAWPENEDLFKGGDVLRKEILSRADGLFDQVLVTDPELQTYVKNSKILQRSIDIEKIETILNQISTKPNPTDPRTITIAHAPSRRSLKGTQELIQCVKALRESGLNIELDIIENVTNVEVFERIQNADLVIDQLLIGWYGVLSVEAMAIGKPVMAYIRQDLIDQLEKDCPLIVTNIQTLENDIKSILNKPEDLKTIGLKSKKFVKRYHCSKVVAQRALEIYETL